VHQNAAARLSYQPSATLSNQAEESKVKEVAGCILCGGALEECMSNLFDTRFGIDDSYEVRRCLGCGLEQMFPVPTAAELKSLYESHYNFGGERRTLYTNLRERFFSSPLYLLWVRVDGDVAFHSRRGAGRLLDIGCNEGRGLKIYARNGFQVEGLELNETAAAVAREAGFIVHTCEIGDLSGSTLYDVAVLSNVLEHAPDPREMLQDICRKLKPGGQVWISCPNSRSWLRTVFGSLWINWHVPFHITHFSAETLEKLLRGTGFATVKTRQITPAHWVTSSLIAKMFAKRGRPTRGLRNPILVAILLVLVRLVFFPALWLGNRWERGDCLLVTASKA
jgi:2-polyprenyl-3-methyl-5-hydroxy-6-metoxy-1,4-benzoquinol methylase